MVTEYRSTVRYGECIQYSGFLPTPRVVHNKEEFLRKLILEVGLA